MYNQERRFSYSITKFTTSKPLHQSTTHTSFTELKPKHNPEKKKKKSAELISYRFNNRSDNRIKKIGSGHESRSSSAFGAIELAENVEGGDEAYEAKTHN